MVKGGDDSAAGEPIIMVEVKYGTSYELFCYCLYITRYYLKQTTLFWFMAHWHIMGEGIRHLLAGTTGDQAGQLRIISESSTRINSLLFTPPKLSCIKQETITARKLIT